MKKVSLKAVVMNDDIVNFVQSGETLDAKAKEFNIGRIGDWVRTTAKFDTWDMYAEPNRYDYVYTPALRKVLREAVDCIKMPFKGNKAALCLYIGLSTAFIYQRNVKHGVCTYHSYKKIRERLGKWSAYLKSWNEFLHILYVPRNTANRRTHVRYANMRHFASDLGAYNAGNRVKSLRKKISEKDADLTMYNDKSNGVFLAAEHVGGLAVHNMGKKIEVEPLPDIQYDLKHTAEDSSTVRGLKWAAEGKC